MKKIISLSLSLCILASPLNVSCFAEDETKNSGSIATEFSKKNAALNIFAKFSIPIVVATVLAGASGFIYYKYKNGNNVITGEVTQKRMSDIFKDINIMKDNNRKCTLIFKNANIRKGAFKKRTFDCNVIFTENCQIEPGACKYTYFEKKFEIKGDIAEGSSLRGAIFRHGDIIIGGRIPEDLLHGALVLIKTSGTRYKLPGKPEIVYDKQNLNEVTKYLETFVK